MMRRFWLLFAQTVPVLLAILFIVVTLKPEWLRWDGLIFLKGTTVTVRESGVQGAHNTVHQTSYSAAVQRAVPAVVSLFTRNNKAVTRRNGHGRLPEALPYYFFGDGPLDQQDEPSVNLGSGVIVSDQGYILTNHHVVDGADEIEVALADGRKTQGTVVGSDPETDVAVVKIQLQHLPAITLGRIENVRVGDVVLAIGNPFAVGQTVTMGIVSALGRSHLGINTFENFIQTDAAINPGNSGGALIDSEGNLLGINTAIFSRPGGSGGSLGIGFAIPVSTAKQIMEEILAHGSVTRGWIGVEPQDITPELAESFDLVEKKGTLIAGVVRGAPADSCGIKSGDILLEVNRKAINDTTSLLNAISQLKPGSTATLTISRKQKKLYFKVIPSKRPKLR
ncbi:MAG: trypsin-like peptidase domain-containing protein [Ottowia sp.]|nr:trypsin-like peptidase domain-containing protein [Ottowia sp.]